MNMRVSTVESLQGTPEPEEDVDISGTCKSRRIVGNSGVTGSSTCRSGSTISMDTGESVSVLNRYGTRLCGRLSLIR